VVSCIRCGCAEGWHTGYDGPCLNAGCRCRAYEPDWAELDAQAIEDALDGFPTPGVTLRHLRPASRAVATHLVELTEPPFFWPIDHQPQHAAEVQRDERLLAEQEEAGSRPVDRTSQAPLAQRIVRQPSELVDGSSNLSGGASRAVKRARSSRDTPYRATRHHHSRLRSFSWTERQVPDLGAAGSSPAGDTTGT
jgi:hypothetical protein